MEEKKNNGSVNDNKGELNIPSPPPVVPSKNNKEKKNNKKFLYILIPVIAVILIAAIVIAVVKTGDKDKIKPVVVTDSNGVPVTDQNGEEVTYIPETEIYEFTDSEGNKQTTVVYKDAVVTVPVTDEKGVAVTDSNGEVVTEQITIRHENSIQGSGVNVVGSTAVAVTDGQGNTVVDNQGNVLTTIVELTTNQANSTQGSGGNVVGTTAIAVTDGQGNTGVDNQGNVLTTIVELTTMVNNVESADTDWQDSLGGTAADYFSSAVTLEDGGYITAVATNSTDGDFAEYAELKYKTPYTVLTKYNKNGDISWQQALGSTKGISVITSLVATDDGGFYAVGYGKNVGGATGKGYYDGAVFKFDRKGTQEWYKSFGTSTVDLFNGATLTSDGGIVVVGSVGNNDGDASGFGKPELESAACIVKYNSEGSLVWKNIVGGNQDAFNGVVEGTDGNLFCVGNFYSGSLFDSLGSSDGGVVKFTSDGKYSKVVSIAGKGIESFTGITVCKNGGVAVVGKSNSSDTSSVSGSMFISDLASRGGYDAYIMKFDNDLSLVFATPFRGQNNDDLSCIVETEDGSFITAGCSNSSTRDLKGITTRGGDDIVIASFSKTGSLSWVRSFGGRDDDSATAICLASDGGYVVAGRSLSTDIDMKGYAQYVSDKTVGVIVKFPE